MRLLIACAALAAAASFPVHALEFRSPARDAPRIVALPAPLEKSAAPAIDDSGRLRVAAGRGLAKGAVVAGWQRASDGWTTRFGAGSAGALGLRVRLDLAEAPGALEVRVQGADGRV